MRRRQSSFELEVFERRSGGVARLDEYLDLYIQHFSPHHRTGSNQLRWYLQNPIEGRRIIYFGLSRLGEPCGFAVLMYYPHLATGVFDFVVIAPNRRGHGAFFELCNQIADYLEAERIPVNYLEPV